MKTNSLAILSIADAFARIRPDFVDHRVKHTTDMKALVAVSGAAELLIGNKEQSEISTQSSSLIDQLNKILQFLAFKETRKYQDAQIYKSIIRVLMTLAVLKKGRY